MDLLSDWDILTMLAKKLMLESRKVGGCTAYRQKTDL